MSDPLTAIVRDYDLRAHWQDPSFPEQCVCELPWPCDASVLYKVVRELLAKLAAAPSPALTREALAAALHFETCALRTVGTRQCKFWWAHIKQADAIIVRLSEAGPGTPPPAELNDVEADDSPWSWGFALTLHAEAVHGCTHTDQARSYFGLDQTAASTSTREEPR